MKRLSYIFTPLLAVLITACAKHEGPGGISDQVKMTFSTEMGATTKAPVNGAQAAELLGNSFVVYGEKHFSDAPTQNVFVNYTVNYLLNSANTTLSNSTGWEYVGQQPSGQSEQTIKYWDFAAETYRMIAYSVGKGDESITPATYASISNSSISGYTLSGTAAELASCYITDINSITPSGYGTPVRLNFYNLASKVRVGLYETIPGYSVQNVRFFISSNDDTGTSNAALYSLHSVIPTGGQYTVSFNDDGKVALSYSGDDSEKTDGLSVGTLTGYSDKFYQEAAGEIYLGRNSNTPTITSYQTVLPITDGTNMMLKVNFDLVSIDGTGQVINVTGATAIVPAQYATWKPNYAYTYIFKISDNMNGHSGTDGPAGLYPVTFDAWTAYSDQGTTSLIGEYSITTYQEADVHDDKVEYVAGSPVVISVVHGTSAEAARISLDGTADFVRVVRQNTNNENDIEPGYSNEQTVSYDNGNASFTPPVDGFYRVEYWHNNGTGTEKLSVKIVKVGNPIGAGGSIEADDTQWDNDFRHAPALINKETTVCHN